MLNISEILFNARKEKGLVLRKVAEAVDIDQSLISKFQKGERIPTKEQAIRLSNFDGISQKKFFNRHCISKSCSTNSRIRVCRQNIESSSRKNWLSEFEKMIYDTKIELSNAK